MRVLVVTNLFPNAHDPLYSPFNRQQFAALGAQCKVDVVAPIPWFPAAARIAASSRAGRFSNVPVTGTVDGLQVAYPRYLHVPKTGQWLAGPLVAARLLPYIRTYRGRVDVVLGAWAYPDGWAAIVLARALGVPAVIKLHGSDMNVVAKLTGPRLMLRGLLPRAARIVAVSRRLGDAAVELGVDPGRVDVVFNGVDRDMFWVRDRHVARDALGLPRDCRLILYVGSLIREKGVGELLEAFDTLAKTHPQSHLAIVGDGPMRSRCETLAQHYPGRISVTGPLPLPHVAEWMGACDVLTLPSWNEGTPNVVLEALTSGRRVVATDVGGIPDLIDDDLLGAMVPTKSSAMLAAALGQALDTEYEPNRVAERGGRGDWDASARNLRQVLANAVASRVS